MQIRVNPRSSVTFLNSLTEHDRNHPDAGTNRATADDNGLATRRRIARSFDGAAAPIDAWCVSHERRSRRRDRAQAEAGLRISPSESRKDRREHQLSRLDAVHRPARLLLLDDQQLGLRA